MADEKPQPFAKDAKRLGVPLAILRRHPPKIDQRRGNDCGFHGFRTWTGRTPL